MDEALVELGRRLRQEKLAREEAESALVAQRSAHDTEVSLLRDALAAEARSTSERLETIESELGQLGDLAVDLERDRDAARAELANVSEKLAVGEAELSRLRAENHASQEQIAALKAELGEARDALEATRAEHADGDARARDERLARERAEAQLREERVTFAQQLQIADGQLRAELESQRRAFDDHTAAVQRSIALLQQQLAEARAAKQPEAVAPPIDSLRADLEQAAARLRELAQEAREDAPAVEDAEPVDPAEPTDLKDRAGELAQVIEDASAESAAQLEAARLPRRELPAEPVTEWMVPAFRRLYDDNPVVAGRLVVDLLPAVANDLGREELIDFAIDEVGAYRLTSHMSSGSVASWRAGSSRKADLALAGSALELSPFALGGVGRRRPKGVAFSGKRRVLWKLLRARRKLVSVNDIQAARVVPGLGNFLALLAANVQPEWVGDDQIVIGFATTGAGAGTWFVRSDENGKLEVTSGLSASDAVVTVAPEAILPLLAGGEPSIAGQPPTVRGDASKALLMLSWFDRAQRSIPPASA